MSAKGHVPGIPVSLVSRNDMCLYIFVRMCATVYVCVRARVTVCLYCSYTQILFGPFNCV